VTAAPVPWYQLPCRCALRCAVLCPVTALLLHMHCSVVGLRAIIGGAFGGFLTSDPHKALSKPTGGHTPEGMAQSCSLGGNRGVVELKKAKRKCSTCGGKTHRGSCLQQWLKDLKKK
jgi:hypothetical protein